MTQEEAIKILKDFHDESALFSVRTALETLYPELKESEDERIRKGLINYFNHHKNGINIFYGIKGDDILAWLEKQGDSPIKWNKNTKDCKPKVSHSVLMKTTHGIAEGEWQGEQWHQYRWAGLVRDADVLSWIELSDLEKQDEQKPFDYENANIQQKDWAEIPFGTKDSELQEATYIIPEGFHAEIKGNEVLIKKGEQKSTWREEKQKL